MTCQSIAQLMQRDLDGDLTREEKSILNQHLQQCEDCKLTHASMQQLSDSLAKLPKVYPPHSIVDNILPQLEALRTDNIGVSADHNKATSIANKWQFSYLSRVTGGVAAAVLLIIVSLSSPSFMTPSQHIGLDMAQSGFATLSQDDSAAKGAAGSSAMNTAPMPEVAEMSDENGVVYRLDNKEPQPPHEIEDVEMRATVGSEAFEASNQPLDFSSQYEVNGVQDRVGRVPAKAQYSSPNGQYVAVVIAERQLYQIVIFNEQGEEVYASHQFEADQVSIVEWTADSKNVRYEAVVGEAVSLTTISVE